MGPGTKESAEQPQPAGDGEPFAAYRDARALVVGGSGFIGRHVVAALARAPVGELFWTARERARAAPEALGVERGRGQVVDLRDDAAVHALIGELRPSITFNLAGYGVDPREADPAEAERLNDRLPGALAEAIVQRRDRASRERGWAGLDLVHAGSALEYGEAGGDLAETTEPRPTTLYGRTKLAGTRRLAEACARLPLRAATARLFMVYGPGEHEGRLVPSLLRAAATRTPLELTAGTQERDFTWVGDVAEGLLRLGVAPRVRPGEVVNLATGRLTSVRAFVEAAARVLAISPELLRFGALPIRDHEMRHVPVAVGRAKELLDWLPATSIEEGLRKIAATR